MALAIVHVTTLSSKWVQMEQRIRVEKITLQWRLGIKTTTFNTWMQHKHSEFLWAGYVTRFISFH